MYVLIELNFEQESLLHAPKWRLEFAKWVVNGSLQSFTSCENQLYKNVCVYKAEFRARITHSSAQVETWKSQNEVWMGRCRASQAAKISSIKMYVFIYLNFEQDSFIQTPSRRFESLDMSCQGSLQSFTSREKQFYKNVFIELNFEQLSLIQAPKWKLESRKMSCQWVIELHNLRKSAL